VCKKRKLTEGPSREVSALSAAFGAHEGFGKGGVGKGTPIRPPGFLAVNAPFAPVENFQMTSVEKDSVPSEWETPKFGLVKSYRVKVCVADDFCSGRNYMVDNTYSPLCICLASL
jgi:hypothetical protein